MRYVRKDFTITKRLADRLSEEKNMSGVVQEALEHYYSSKDTARRLIKVAIRLEALADQLENGKTLAVGRETCCSLDKAPHKHWQPGIVPDTIVNIVTGEVIEVG